MRRIGLIAIVASACAATVVIAAGCARKPVGGETTVPAGASSAAGGREAGDWPPNDKAAEVYTQVLRRYLTTPAENSFGDGVFSTIYVLDRAVPDAGYPHERDEGSKAIPADTQRRVLAALAEVARISFVADRNTVIVIRDGCAQVRDHGILITLGLPDGDDETVRVGINGFVACLGATWLTYVVEKGSGTGWRVAGTTGDRAIA